MKIDWRALLLAPVFIPTLYCLAFVMSASGGDWLMDFLIIFAIGCVVSYGATLLLLLPVLLVAARIFTLNMPRVCMLGATLGGLTYLPLGWLMYRTSGPDSGPPTATFIDQILAQLADPLTLSFPVAGLVTAALYWVFAGRQAGDDGASSGDGTSMP